MSGCFQETPLPTANFSILDVVGKNYNSFSTAYKMISESGIAPALSTTGSGQYTLFIPSDQAFLRLNDSQRQRIKCMPPKALLQYHLELHIYYL